MHEMRITAADDRGVFQSVSHANVLCQNGWTYHVMPLWQFVEQFLSNLTSCLGWRYLGTPQKHFIYWTDIPIPHGEGKGVRCGLCLITLFSCCWLFTSYVVDDFCRSNAVRSGGYCCGDLAVCVFVTLMYCAQTTESIIKKLYRIVAKPF